MLQLSAPETLNNFPMAFIFGRWQWKNHMEIIIGYTMVIKMLGNGYFCGWFCSFLWYLWLCAGSLSSYWMCEDAIVYKLSAAKSITVPPPKPPKKKTNPLPPYT
eukprot:14089_1